MNIRECFINLIQKNCRREIKFSFQVNNLTIPRKILKSYLIQQTFSHNFNIIKKPTPTNLKCFSTHALNIYDPRKRIQKDFSAQIKVCFCSSPRNKTLTLYSANNINQFNSKSPISVKEQIISEYISWKKNYLTNVVKLNTISFYIKSRKMNLKFDTFEERKIKTEKPNSRENINSSWIFESTHPDISVNQESKLKFQVINSMPFQFSNKNELEDLKSGISIRKGIWKLSIKQNDLNSRKNYNKSEKMKSNTDKKINLLKSTRKYSRNFLF